MIGDVLAVLEADLPVITVLLAFLIAENVALVTLIFVGKLLTPAHVQILLDTISTLRDTVKEQDATIDRVQTALDTVVKALESIQERGEAHRARSRKPE